MSNIFVICILHMHLLSTRTPITQNWDFGIHANLGQKIFTALRVLYN